MSNIKYHHIGLLRSKPMKNEDYNREWKFYGSGYFESEFGVEWLRIEEDSKLPLLIKSTPHIAFVIENLETAIKGQKVIYGPNNPSEGVSVCFIEYEGSPVEFLQFHKAEKEVWPNFKKIVSPVNLEIKADDELDIKFHHFSICSKDIKTGSSYSENHKFHFTDFERHPFGIQWVCYENDSPLPEIVRNTSHIAFQVNNIEKALRGKEVIVEVHRSEKGTLEAFFVENEAPIKLIQTE